MGDKCKLRGDECECPSATGEPELRRRAKRPVPMNRLSDCAAKPRSLAAVWNPLCPHSSDCAV